VGPRLLIDAVSTKSHWPTCAFTVGTKRALRIHVTKRMIKRSYFGRLISHARGWLRLRDLQEARVEAKAEYESGWRTLHEIARCASRESGGNLARVLSKLSTVSPADANKELLDRYGFRVFGVRLKTSLDYRYESTLFEFVLQNELLNRIDNDTVNIVELGSGYGKNLFRIWLNGGPVNANYVGLELTESGRRCASFLSSLEPRIRFQSRPFNYHNPALIGFDSLAKTFVFTSYSIEQIRKVCNSVFDQILALPGLHRVVHVEPVGWQRSLENVVDPEERELMREAKRSASELSYNTNLLDLLERFQRGGRIVIEEGRFDFVAHRPNLPGTLLVWRPVR
jgi:hypothetical protein